MTKQEHAHDEHSSAAQEAEQRMRDERDRKTKGPKGGAGEPRYRNGADTDMNPDDAKSGHGWAETPGKSAPPRGGKQGSGAPN